MPSALPRSCPVFGCPERVPCPTHTVTQRQIDLRRGSRHARGYGDRWDKHRQHFIREQFNLSVPRAGLCGARLPGARQTTDSLCAQQGYLTSGVVADHIVPVSGPNDPTFWELTALQFLCDRCHQAKRQRESRGVKDLT